MHLLNCSLSINLFMTTNYDFVTTNTDMKYIHCLMIFLFDTRRLFCYNLENILQYQ